MLFNSLEFILFAPTIVALYFLTPFRLRWALLLVASYYFYACWRVEYLGLIILSTLIDYIAGIRIDKSRANSTRKLWLVLSICSNLGVLFFFKYYDFFLRSLTQLPENLNPLAGLPIFNFLLPVGISFYTFQSMSYTIDVYRKHRKAERHLGVFAVYVSFFPQLVAGPIERSTTLMPQFFQKHSFDSDRVISGLELMLWGFFQKLVVADRLAVYVEKVFAAPEQLTGALTWIGVYFFAFQIYCDFSSYTYIARGTARMMGYDLMDNFRQPYFAQNLSDFWRRWHISLSTWFRDYLYIPLGGKQTTKWKWYRNLFLVFLLSGLWHGANWTFVAWGFLHGIGLILLFALPLPKRLPYLVKVGITFHVVCLAWVFFRAGSLSHALAVLTAMFEPTNPISLLIEGNKFDFGITLVGLAFVLISDAMREFFKKEWLERPLAPTWRWSLSHALLLMIFLFNSVESPQFLYFQF